MKNFKIQTMHIQDFKGIKKLDLNLEGRDIAVFGSNGTGKTSISDAVSWLFTGKYSQGPASFVGRDGKSG